MLQYNLPFPLLFRAVQHLIVGRDSVDYSSSGSAMELSSFEFSLHLFLPIYSRTVVIDMYNVFTGLKENIWGNWG